MTYTITDGDYVRTITSAASALEALGIYMEANTPPEELVGPWIAGRDSEGAWAKTRNHHIKVQPESKRVAA